MGKIGKGSASGGGGGKGWYASARAGALAPHANKHSARRAHTDTAAYKLINKTAAFYWNVKAGILVFFAVTPQNMYGRGLHVNGRRAGRPPVYRSLFSHPVVSTGR